MKEPPRAGRTLLAIPNYNEAATLPRVLDAMRPSGLDALVVDDGSRDDSVDVARAAGAFVLEHGRNQGYGQSLIDAFAWAAERGYEWVITLDADGQHAPENLPAFLDAIATDQYDLVSGSRYLAESVEQSHAPAERRQVNRRVTALLNRVLGLDLTDSFCGYKAHRVGPTLDLALSEAGYAFPLQLWPRVAVQKLRLTEVPVHRIYIDYTRSFGADLDDARRRFAHYVSVLNAELRRAGRPAVDAAWDDSDELAAA